MKQIRFTIEGIPAILWGEPSDKLFIHVHGKMSRKEFAREFAEIADAAGFQTLSFDLPEHGERMGTLPRCDIWAGIRDLNTVADWAFARYAEVSCFACSLGAYFALHTYAGRPLKRCFFQSPIVDMDWLTRRMMEWSDVTEERLAREGEIDTPIDALRWDYVQWIRANPVTRWPHETRILYGALDNLQPIESLRAFAEAFGADLTVAEGCEHPFMAEKDGPIVRAWMEAALKGNS